jgi:DNA-directed RNA polymerase sigma subunit (sigma70/sigma32)
VQDERLTPDEQFSEEMIRQNLEEALNELSPREAGILRMRLGLDGVQEATLEDIGEHFQVTRERIRQIEAKAFQKLAMRQNASSGVVHELHQGRLQGLEAGSNSPNSAARSSRGTKKT